MARRCYNKAKEGQLNNTGENLKKRFRAAGGGRRTKVPKICVALLEWFAGVQTSLSSNIFLLKARECLNMG